MEQEETSFLIYLIRDVYCVFMSTCLGTGCIMENRHFSLCDKTLSVKFLGVYTINHAPYLDSLFLKINKGKQLTTLISLSHHGSRVRKYIIILKHCCIFITDKHYEKCLITKMLLERKDCLNTLCLPTR